MRRYMVLFACVLAAILSLPVSPVAATDWTSDSVANALLAVQFPADDLNWQSAMMDDTADAYPGATRQLQVYTFDSLTVFSIYPTAAEAAQHVAGDFCMAIDQDTIDIHAGTDFTGRLVSQEASHILGIDVCISDTGTGAGAVGRIDNVVVSGVSSYSVTNLASGAAHMAAVNGLALVSALIGNASGSAPAPTPRSASTTAAAPKSPTTAPRGSAAPSTAASSNRTPPMAFLPYSLTAGAAKYRMETDDPISLTGSPAIRAVAGYDASEVAWILDHPEFMGGGPYATVTQELGGDGNDFIAQFNDPAYVGSQLDALGWQDGHQRIFTLDNPVPGGLGYIVASVNRFSSPAAASSALDVLYGDLTTTGAMVPVDVDPMGSRSAAVAGDAVNGVQMTALVVDGSYLFVVTGVAPNGDPTTGVESVLDLMLAA